MINQSTFHKFFTNKKSDKSLYVKQIFFWQIRAIEEINAEIYAAINQREPTNAHNKYNVVNSL